MMDDDDDSGDEEKGSTSNYLFLLSSMHKRQIFVFEATHASAKSGIAEKNIIQRKCMTLIFTSDEKDAPEEQTKKIRVPQHSLIHQGELDFLDIP